jgi:hypothetical protein
VIYELEIRITAQYPTGERAGWSHQGTVEGGDPADDLGRLYTCGIHLLSPLLVTCTQTVHGITPTGKPFGKVRRIRSRKTNPPPPL